LSSCKVRFIADEIVYRFLLKYEIVRAISCCPATTASSPALVKKRLQELANTVYEKGCFAAVAAVECKSQFTDLCSRASDSLIAAFSWFSLGCDRLDIGRDTEFSVLFAVELLVLTLSSE